MSLVTFCAPCPPRQRARATEYLFGSVCVELQDRVWALMCGAGREEHPTVHSGPISVVEAERDTTYAFPKNGTVVTLTVAFMNSIPKRFLRTLVGGQGHRGYAMDYIQQDIPLRPLVNRREARAAVENLGSYQLQWSTLLPRCQLQCSLIMCTPPLRKVKWRIQGSCASLASNPEHVLPNRKSKKGIVKAPPQNLQSTASSNPRTSDDAGPYIGIRGKYGGLVRVVLSEGLCEFDLIRLDRVGGGWQCKTPQN